MARKKGLKGAKVCISIEETTKNRIKSMGSKGDTYDDVINGLIDLTHIVSNPETAAAVASECKMSERFCEEIKDFSRSLAKRGKAYRNCDYSAQKLMLRLDLLS
jgi:hypothetical protein